MRGRAAKQRPKPRRPTTPAPSTAAVADGIEASPQQSSLQYSRSSTTSARPAQRRSTAPPRPTTALAFNYAYLSHDIRTLFILAPSMIVLLVAAYFVLH
ncbi:MAG TPA: hypothetical protein DEV93_05220 [Chloroflexi bacterium]|jgi:hypothetical protein|nr:hypothetical protein [Chloroflexota bacterium]